MSALINMTNHLQLILVPWYMPFEAMLQAQLGVAHPVDLVHKHRIISPNYPVALIIHLQPPKHTTVCAAYRSMQDWPILHFVGETVGFSSAEQGGIWTIPQCDLILMTASSPHYHEMTQISTNSCAKRTNPCEESLLCCCVDHKCSSLWLTAEQVFHFGLKLSISSLLHIPTKLQQSWWQLAAAHTEGYFWEVKVARVGELQRSVWDQW